MITSRVRSALLGSAVGVGLIAASTTANALEYNFGGVQVFLDTTVSAGVSMRVAETNPLHLPEGNGGPLDQRTLLGPVAGGTVAAPSAAANTPGAVFVPDTRQGDNFGGSVNGDDGRLNFDQWDLTSGTVKMTNDIQANYENYKFFARVSSFYDAVLDRDSSFARSQIGDGAEVDTVRDIDLLDFYVSGDFNVGDLPLNVRLGKQVVNWGEATFILNGISSWNPFDVNAFRRPGAEIKEGLLPVWGAYASLGLPYDLSLEAFYQLEWEELQLDRPGTPFATSDVARFGSQFGGNVNAGAFTSGSQRSGTFKRNCGGGGLLQAAGVSPTTCAQGDGSFIDYRDDIAIGINEQVRFANGDLSVIRRAEDREASDSGQYGAALRWYAEDLNSTEFGFYFMNYHSRLPIVSQRTLAPVIGISTSNASTTVLTRQLISAGCLNPDLSGGAVPGGAPGVLTAANVTGLFASQLFGNPSLATVGAAAGTTTTAGGGQILDPQGLLSNAALDAAVDATALGLSLSPLGTKAVTVSGLAPTLGKLALINCVIAAANSDFTAAGVTAAVTAGFANPAAPTAAESATLTAALEGAIGFQPTAVGGLSDALPILRTGTETLSTTFQSELYFEYPEDIKLIGTSFNTTIGDWGVQGEVAFRLNAPFQLDTDSITIGAAAANCAFATGDAILLGFEGLVNQGTSCAGSLATGSIIGQEISGVVREEAVNFDIGTTATYTNSNPLVGALGADIGILLTELGAMYVPDVPEEGDFTARQWGNVCTGGSDLPLGGLLALDARAGCRPTQFSYGYVLVGILQYNNAFGTPITLSPQVAWSHDVKGNSPAPMSNFREGRKRVSLAVNGSYQNTWRGGISYVNNFGNEKYTNTGDQDFVSINLSYSF
jgi:Protein of unknown function (DUF1302)